MATPSRQDKTMNQVSGYLKSRNHRELSLSAFSSYPPIHNPQLVDSLALHSSRPPEPAPLSSHPKQPVKAGMSRFVSNVRRLKRSSASKIAKDYWKLASAPSSTFPSEPQTSEEEEEEEEEKNDNTSNREHMSGSCPSPLLSSPLPSPSLPLSTAAAAAANTTTTTTTATEPLPRRRRHFLARLKKSNGTIDQSIVIEKLSDNDRSNPFLITAKTDLGYSPSTVNNSNNSHLLYRQHITDSSGLSEWQQGLSPLKRTASIQGLTDNEPITRDVLVASLKDTMEELLYLIQMEEQKIKLNEKEVVCYMEKLQQLENDIQWMENSVTKSRGIREGSMEHGLGEVNRHGKALTLARSKYKAFMALIEDYNRDTDATQQLEHLQSKVRIAQRRDIAWAWVKHWLFPTEMMTVAVLLVVVIVYSTL